MDSGSNDITFKTEIYFQYQPQIQLSLETMLLKLIFVEMFSVSQNAHCATEVENSSLFNEFVCNLDFFLA
jgi:hypothetical protein